MTNYIHSELGEDSIVYHDLSGVVNLTKEVVEKLRIRREKLAALQNKHYVITLFDGVLTVDFEAQEYLSHSLFSNKLAASAFVGSGFLFEHFTAMFFRYHQPCYPTQRFLSLQEAQAWINTQRQSQICYQRTGA